MTRVIVILAAAFSAAVPLAAQTTCPGASTFNPCDIAFEIPEAEAARHPNPYLSVQLHAEFRSPDYKTFLVHAFWDGGRRMVIRFSPTEPGKWVYRLTSNIAAFQGQTGEFAAADSGAQGFLRVDNLRHWSYTVKRNPHLWMGDTCYRLAWIDQATFDQMVAKRAGQKFNHMRGLVMHDDPKLRAAFTDPNTPNHEHFRQLDARVRALHDKVIFTDLVIASDQNHLVKVFPERDQRERYVRYLIARYSPYRITWQGVQEFEEYEDGRGVLKEVGEILVRHDPYKHPRSTHAVTTSAPLLRDGWMTHIVYQSSDNSLGLIDSQITTVPRINAEFAYEDSGAGKSHKHHVDSAEFRRRLWHATMNGQYPTFGNTGTYGGRAFAVDAKFLDSPGAKAMSDWFEFFSRTRFWELEPFFELDGGRAVALPGIEYIVYIDKPGPVEIVTEKKKYDVYWFNIETGELRHEKKEYKGERYTANPPGPGEWVLHLSRDGRKDSMLNSYYFESRRVVLQVVESNPQRVPFEIVEPAAETLPAGKPIKFSIKLKRETRATSQMHYLWLADATAGGQGFRVLASGAQGEFQIPARAMGNLPAVVNLRLYGLNLNGKVYSIDRVIRVTE
jgi:hypothetical protein